MQSPMISARGAITTNVAMVECASGQSSQGREVFLLSELEKVWVAASILVRRALCDGQNIQIPGLGAFWIEERCLIADTLRYRQRFNVRRVCFGVDRQFALRYGLDRARSTLEREGVPYVKVRMADIVNVCAVPAHTASMALREFVMYLGEGLYCGRTFHLAFPGVATLTIKRERFTLLVDAELDEELFEQCARKWPAEIREAGRERLAAERMPPLSAASSRPPTRASRPRTASSAAPSGVSAGRSSSLGAGPRPVFNAAAPKDRLFADIEKEAARRREAELLRRQAFEEDARRQAALDRAMAHHNGYAAAGRDDSDTYGSYGGGRPVTGESVYGWMPDGEPIQAAAAATATEPDVEVFELTPEKPPPFAAATARPPAEGGSVGEGRPLGRKDPQLEDVLRQEESFSRPLSRRVAYEHASVRDLIYGAPSADPVSPAARARRVDPNRDAIAVSPQHCAPAGHVPALPQHGRKRCSELYGTHDTVGGLLKGTTIER